MDRQYYVPTVVRLRIKGGIVVQGCDVYVSRPQYQGGWKLEGSIWANPYKCKTEEERVIAVNSYRVYILGEITKNPNLWIPILKNIVSQNRSLTLGCWCKADSKGNYKDVLCHADVIVELCKIGRAHV